MKEIKKFTPSNDHYKIPSRDEFHRYYGGEITDKDFCTAYPTGYMAEKIEKAIVWTKKNATNTRQTRKDEINK